MYDWLPILLKNCTTADGEPHDALEPYECEFVTFSITFQHRAVKVICNFFLLNWSFFNIFLQTKYYRNKIPLLTKGFNSL